MPFEIPETYIVNCRGRIYLHSKMGSNLTEIGQKLNCCLLADNMTM